MPAVRRRGRSGIWVIPCVGRRAMVVARYRQRMSPSIVLAAGSGTSWIFTVVGVVIVIALLVLLWSGRRRLAQRPEPPQSPQPRSDSWDTPDDDTKS
ncbi:DUF6479 family protein [Streptomyces sp. NPDC050658]|uniref:DUF6479 family protein n=1 Tax=unclassified Streptomyces TaxID=2593676 RepID=UPI0034131958